FRGSTNTAIRVFERALQLDPTFHLAFQHVLDALLATNRDGYERRRCPAPGPIRPECTYRAFVLRDHDSLVTVPVPAADTAAFAAQGAAYIRADTRRRNLDKAREKALAWVNDAPNENRAHIVLGG